MKWTALLFAGCIYAWLVLMVMGYSAALPIPALADPWPQARKLEAIFLVWLITGILPSILIGAAIGAFCHLWLQVRPWPTNLILAAPNIACICYWSWDLIAANYFPMPAYWLRDNAIFIASLIGAPYWGIRIARSRSQPNSGLPA